MDLGAAVYKIQEAAGLTQSNVRDQLRNALRDAFPVTSDGYCYPWLADIIGDDQAGSIVYELSGKLYRCDYLISADGTARTTKLSISTAEVVMPRTVYDRADGTILESKRVALKAGSLFSEAIEFIDMPMLREAAGKPKTDYKIKVIQAGKGSSAFYPKEVLQRDGPKVFKAGTHMYWNHPTAAQEASRPEGDLNDLAAVLTSDAAWEEAGAKGPGLYANAKVFADYAEKVQSKAGAIGVSIRAYGEAETKKDTGLTLTSFTRAESVDFVTQAGAGGAVLTEAARGASDLNSQGENMELTEAAVQAMIEKQVAPLAATIATQKTTIETQATSIAEANRRAVLAEAKTQVSAALLNEQLPAPSKARVAEAVLAATLPVTEAGLLDGEKLKTAIAEAVKSEGLYLASINPQTVFGMGATEGAGAANEAEASGRLLEMSTRQAATAGVSEAAAKAFAKGRG